MLPGSAPILSSVSSASGPYVLSGELTGKLNPANQNSLLYSPKPIRFDNGIIISGSSALGSARCHYMYELD